jgi:hypothetical protein
VGAGEGGVAVGVGGDDVVVEPHGGQGAGRGVAGHGDGIPIAVVAEAEGMGHRAEVEQLAADAFEGANPPSPC